jgi:Cu+-exporting ATPase
MDVLIAIGITASYTYAVILILLGIVTGEDSHGADFFETSAVLISFVLFGKLLQLLAVRRTGDALTKLMNLAMNGGGGGTSAWIHSARDDLVTGL